YFYSTDKPKRYPFSLSKFFLKLFIFTSLYLQRSVMCMFLWTEFRDPRFYPSSCESLPSIATIRGLTEAARLGVHNVIEFLSDDSPDMDVIGISVIRREIGNKVLKTSVSGLVELNILKNLTVYVVAGSLGRFKSHANNIVFDEHNENILPSSEGDVGLAASSGPSVLEHKVDEECAAADPPEISDAQNNRKRCQFRDPRFYPSSCESLPSIATIGGLTEAARLGTSQAELKDGTTRAPIVRSLRNVGYHFQQIYEATNCSLYIGREKMAMYGSVVTPVWCNGDVHGNQSDDSPDMDVIGVFDNFFSDINKPAAVNCIEGHDSSLGRFKSHASNIVFDLLAKIQSKTWRALKLMEAINNNHRTFTISTITEDTIIENHGKEHSENILPSSEGDVGLAASSGPSVLGHKVDEECAAADPPEISDAQNNCKRCRE
ncbi:hypothetical protein HID58_066411, partial [Brassica napus]